MKLSEFKAVIDEAAIHYKLSDDEIEIEIEGPDCDFFEVIGAYPTDYEGRYLIIIELGDYKHHP